LPTNGTRTSYRLESGTATGLSNLSPVPIASTATSVTLNAATATTFVRLVAVNAIGASAPSNEVQLVVGATPATPFTPTDVRVAVDGFTAVFHWSASAGATATQFVLDAGANTPGVFNLVSGIPFGNGFTFAASAPAGTYNVRLRAVNAAGSSLPAGELFVTLPAAPAVATAPALLRANVEPNRTVTLAWAPPLVGVATSYVVEAGSAAGLANLAVLTVGPAPSLQVVAPPGSYFVRVRAVNSAGTSAVSNEIVVTVP
jgi:predicted phage tail protein